MGKSYQCIINASDSDEYSICLMDMTISIKNCTSGKIEYTLELDEAEEAFAQRPEPG
jgi:hypothetical protein